MKRLLILSIIVLIIFTGCSSAEQEREKETYNNIEILKEIEIATFSARNVVFIDGNNDNDFLELWKEEPQIVQDFLKQKGKLVVLPDIEVLSKIEENLNVPIQSVETKCEEDELVFIVFCEHNGEISARKVLVSDGVHYECDDIIRIAITRIEEEEHWEEISANVPKYIGSEGYLYVGENNLVLNVRQDIYTIQDVLGQDTYFVITNFEANSDMDMKCSLETKTSSMTYIASEPCGITPAKASEVKLMTGLETISWKQNVESIEIEADTMPKGKLWNVLSSSEETILKLGIAWDCPMQKEEVVFLSKIQVKEFGEDKIIEDTFSYKVYDDIENGDTSN